MKLEDALREFALEIIPKSLNDKRLRPNAVLHRAEDLGLVVRVPATAEPMIVGVLTSDDPKEHHDGREAEDDDR